MADGKTHFVANISMAIAIGVGSIPLYFLEIDPTLLITLNLSSLAHIYLSPDLDLEQIIYPQERMSHFLTFWIPSKRIKKSFYEALNKGQEFFFAGFSIPMAHRSWLSHLPPIGTILKLLYVYFWGYFLFIGRDLSIAFWQLYDFVILHPEYILVILLAGFLQDLSHLALDKFKIHL